MMNERREEQRDRIAMVVVVVVEVEQGSGKGGRRQRVGGGGLGGGGKKKGKKYVWFGRGGGWLAWASNSGHRARMTSNRSRALCQHSPGPNTSVILISRFIDGKPSRGFTLGGRYGLEWLLDVPPPNDDTKRYGDKVGFEELVGGKVYRCFPAHYREDESS